ncbi:MAG: DUF2306 domain-containing protein [Pseudomonadota bacterium]
MGQQQHHNRLHGLQRRLRQHQLPYWLLALSVVPLVAGAVRLLQLANGSVAPGDARFSSAPVPVVLHIVCVGLYCVLGAFQFDTGLRSRRPAWHRRAGWLTLLSGLMTALTGLWMTLFYPIPPVLQGSLLLVVRVVVGTAMLAFLLQGIAAILARDIPRHRAMMARAYALGQGAGTQVILFVPVAIVFGEITGLPRDVLMSAAWVLNLALVEALLAQRPQPGGSRGLGSRPHLL